MVGFVIFLALIAIQYLVINHGAVRTAEVAARFTLDAMPGKQMAIDADLNAGLIDEAQARARRRADRARGGILRRHGRRGALQPARRAGHHSDHGHQYFGRIPDRRVSTQHSLRSGAENLHDSHRGRRSGDHDSVAACFRGGRHGRHAHLDRRDRRRRIRPAAFRQEGAAAHRRRRYVPAGDDSRASQISFLLLAAVDGLSGLSRAQTRRQRERRAGTRGGQERKSRELASSRSKQLAEARRI